MARKQSAEGNIENRNALGRRRKDAMFPVAPTRAGLPSGYAGILRDLKQRIQQERLRTVMAAQVFKDPYLFDFLGTADPRRERKVEQALVDHIQRFLLELGAGFAFMGRQVHLEVGSQDYYLDLLFYHVKLRSYVVVELKAVPFDPAFVGQMNLYLSAVDDLLRHLDDKPSIGLLLCKEKNKITVEYALRDLKKPIGVAEWRTRLVESLPKRLKGQLPSIKQIEKELGNT